MSSLGDGRPQHRNRGVLMRRFLVAGLLAISLVFRSQATAATPVAASVKLWRSR